MKNLIAIVTLLSAGPALADDYDAYRIACTASQISATMAASATARDVLKAAAAALPPINSKTGQAFQTWFGGAEGETDPKLKELYDDLQTRLIFTSHWCPPPASFGDLPRHPGLYAWVPPFSETEIFLEQRFFESPTTGEDSQAGTLIHELSHNSPVAEIVDTDNDGDGDKDYGTAQAKKLARHNPGAARRTADNVQYFAEDIFWGI